MSIENSLGLVILEARLASGLSQNDLATKMGCPRTYISKVENRKALPTITSLNTFAAGLGLKVSQLIRMAEDAPEEVVRQKTSIPGSKPRVDRDAIPRGALVHHNGAVERRLEIGRALGTLPRETR